MRRHKDPSRRQPKQKTTQAQQTEDPQAEDTPSGRQLKHRRPPQPRQPPQPPQARGRCTRYVAVHPNRRGALPTDRVQCPNKQEQTRNWHTEPLTATPLHAHLGPTGGRMGTPPTPPPALRPTPAQSDTSYTLKCEEPENHCEGRPVQLDAIREAPRRRGSEDTRCRRRTRKGRQGSRCRRSRRRRRHQRLQLLPVRHHQPSGHGRGREDHARRSQGSRDGAASWAGATYGAQLGATIGAAGGPVGIVVGGVVGGIVGGVAASKADGMLADYANDHLVSPVAKWFGG